MEEALTQAPEDEPLEYGISGQAVQTQTVQSEARHYRTIHLDIPRICGNTSAVTDHTAHRRCHIRFLLYQVGHTDHPQNSTKGQNRHLALKNRSG